MSNKTATEPRGVIVKDADLKAMNTISKAMADLTADQQVEVYCWFRRRYEDKRPGPQAPT